MERTPGKTALKQKYEKYGRNASLFPSKWNGDGLTD
jgi:hypothetical protein